MKTRGYRAAAAAILLAVAALLSAGCSNDPVVAEVAGDKIMKSEFDKVFSSYKTQIEKQYGTEVWQQEENGKKKIDTARDQILDMLIDSRLVTTKAKELGVEVTDTAVNKEIENARGYFESEEKFKEFLTEQKMTLEYLTDTIRKDLLFTALYEKINEGTAVTEQEISEFYKNNVDQFFEVTASHILVATESEAIAVKSRLDQGDDFADLAKELSTDPSAKENGGSLGSFSHGAMVAPFDQAVFAMKPGEISIPVKTEFGYHIIRCEGLNQKSLEDASESIRSQLLMTKQDNVYTEMLNQMKDDTEIKKYPEKLQ